jgi:hypothetical protein
LPVLRNTNCGTPQLQKSCSLVQRAKGTKKHKDNLHADIDKHSIRIVWFWSHNALLLLLLLLQRSIVVIVSEIFKHTNTQKKSFSVTRLSMALSGTRARAAKRQTVRLSPSDLTNG